jgi:hypothetical protein
MYRYMPRTNLRGPRVALTRATRAALENLAAATLLPPPSLLAAGGRRRVKPERPTAVAGLLPQFVLGWSLPARGSTWPPLFSAKSGDGRSQRRVLACSLPPVGAGRRGRDCRRRQPLHDGCWGGPAVSVRGWCLVADSGKPFSSLLIRSKGAGCAIPDLGREPRSGSQGFGAMGWTLLAHLQPNLMNARAFRLDLAFAGDGWLSVLCGGAGSKIGLALSRGLG